MKKLSLEFLGFVQGTSLIVYLLIVSAVMERLATRFGNNQSFVGPVVYLLFFIISAVISATIVLGQSGILFWEKKFKESFKLLAWTVFWCSIYLTIFLYIHFR